MSNERPIDLRSDTVTRPTPAMREAMARAEVGDDVFGEDPTVNALQERAARLLGKEAALFVPTGTLANLVAILAQTRPGDSVLMHEDAHPFNYESGNLAVVGGLLVRPVPGELGILDPQALAGRVIPGTDHHFAPTTLIAIENTTNRGGGAIYPLETAEAIAVLARSRGLRVHCDGARLFNAAVETGVPAAEYARHAHTVSFCFSKGLGAPAGSMVVGDAETVDRAHRFRKMLGGGMRQAGILAAAALHALDHHVDRLREDHARARRFRARLEGTPGLRFPLPSPTNIVYVDVPDARAVAERLREQGVLVLPTGSGRLRVVFHLDVSDAGADIAADALRAVVARPA